MIFGGSLGFKVSGRKMGKILLVYNYNVWWFFRGDFLFRGEEWC